ncbi:hypothetical protein EYC84_003134 [Monilinia fructicola]|uniref:Uncharacterized protein n=1 Tax=Monilinia fructicola TaxID=38448 RepID=A0A5M9JSP9_MONFR|nr:hypothetical protein EYC84_003134 [Monilinia fructicola]
MPSPDTIYGVENHHNNGDTINIPNAFLQARIFIRSFLLRLWFAISPSYLHPDENFQGPEVIAGQIFSYPVKLTWEFTSDNPIRSVFPLWPIYMVYRCSSFDGSG